MSNLEIREENPLQIFLYALRAPESKRQYPRRLKVVFDYLQKKQELKSKDLDEQCKEFICKTKENSKWANIQLMEFVLFQKDRVAKGEIVSTTIRNYIKAAKLFIDMNSEVPLINWKRITKSLPPPKNFSNARIPSLSELKKLIAYPDRRIKPIILCMLSGAFRISSWNYLKWKHVLAIKNEKNEIIAAKVTIYADEPEEYFCFITPEAYEALSDYINFRQSSGEDITGESWLIRDIWATTDFNAFKNSTLGFVKYPKQLKSSGIKSLIERAMRAQGLAKPLQNGVKRREWKSGHGYRSFFKTKAEQVMKPANVELLSGRTIGIANCYYKPTQSQILEDFLNAVPLLTINEEYRIKNKMKQLESDKSQIELMELKHQMDLEKVKEDYNKVISLIQQNPKLAHAKPETLLAKSKY
jgi:hypothetical protein